MNGGQALGDWVWDVKAQHAHDDRAGRGLGCVLCSGTDLALGMVAEGPLRTALNPGKEGAGNTNTAGVYPLEVSLDLVPTDSLKPVL